MDVRTELWQDLQRIEAEEYRLREGESAQHFISSMLEYIGDPDPELRDGLIYPVFYMWIHKEPRFTDAELSSLLAVLLDDSHLFHGIGSTDGNSVFTRAFSVLPVALILERHRLQPFLTEGEWHGVKDALLRYYREEKDYRGYDAEYGWAHAPAHAADALNKLVLCPECDAAVELEVLDALGGMLQNGVHIFSEEEDERIATVIDSVIVRGLMAIGSMIEWVKRLAECGSRPRSRAADINRINCKNMVRCLVVRREEGGYDRRLMHALRSAECKLNPFAAKA